MDEAIAGDFIYSLRDKPAEQQAALLKAKLAADPTLEETMAFELWKTDPHNLNRPFSPLEK